MKHLPGTLAVWWWWRGRPRQTGIIVHRFEGIVPGTLVTLEVFSNQSPRARYKNALRQLWHNGLYLSLWLPCRQARGER